MKTHTLKVLSALFLSLFLVTACSKTKNTGTPTEEKKSEASKKQGE